MILNLAIIAYLLAGAYTANSYVNQLADNEELRSHENWVKWTTFIICLVGWPYVTYMVLSEMLSNNPDGDN